MLHADSSLSSQECERKVDFQPPKCYFYHLSFIDWC